MENLYDLLLDKVSPLDSASDIGDILIDLVCTHSTLGCGDCWEIVEARSPEIMVMIKKECMKAYDEARIYPLEIIDEKLSIIRGSSVIDPTLSETEISLRNRRSKAQHIDEALKKLSPLEFEKACRTILDVMGCENPKISQYSNDGGIDFYGQLSLEGRLSTIHPYGGIDKRMNIWLIGQAKKYTRPVGPSFIRELIGSVEIARTGSATQLWEGLLLHPFDPVVVLIFTTSKFSDKALELLRNTGILYMDGSQLVSFLADSGIGLSSSDGEIDMNELYQSLIDCNF